MSDSTANSWRERLSALSDILESAHKQLRKVSADPFEVSGSVNSARQMLQGASIELGKYSDAILSEVESECIRLEAEFWGLLTEACTSRGWNVLGTTNRRLINKSLFLSLEGRAVKVEGLARVCTPFVPSVIAALAPILDEIRTPEAELKAFLNVLGKAYDAVPRPGSECSLEAAYRQCLFESQKPAFWRSPNATSLVVLTRPTFRYRLSEILRLGLLTSDGRGLALGTTTMSKDAWEVYSPGEDRVVIAGRLSLTRSGGSDGH